MPDPVLPVGVGVALWVAGALWVGVEVDVAVGAGVGGWVVCVGRPLGSGVAPPSAEHRASSIRQPVGSPLPLTTKPTVTDLPGARPSVSHVAGFTVTC
ncbi:hypothetical protein SCANM63S_05173 [Streptomyces canarius]